MRKTDNVIITEKKVRDKINNLNKETFISRTRWNRP